MTLGWKRFNDFNLRTDT